MNPTLSRALRGILPGLAICAAMSVLMAWASADNAQYANAHPELDGPELAVVEVSSLLFWVFFVGLPTSYVVASLVAWTVRLNRPWLFGSAATLTAVVVYLLSMRLSSGPGLPHGPAWLVPVLCIAVAGAGIAA